MTRLNQKVRRNGGMTYVELIVVLGIFAILSSVAIFNYGAFQAKVDIKNLASDIALRVVQAQKSALSGEQNINEPLNWKPSYGVYFNPGSNNSFIYFANLNNNYFFDGSNCTNECLNYVSISKNDFIQKVESYLGSSPTQITNPIAVTFTRPDSRAYFSYANNIPLSGFDFIQITVASPSGAIALIKIYPSGRIQVN